MWRPVLAVLLVTGCTREPSAPPRATSAAPPPSVATLPEAPSPSPSPSPETAEFGGDAINLYRVVACVEDAPLPKGLSAEVVAEHCQWMRPRMERYRKE